MLGYSQPIGPRLCSFPLVCVLGPTKNETQEDCSKIVQITYNKVIVG
jgi:hypothetical protein